MDTLRKTPSVIAADGPRDRIMGFASRVALLAVLIALVAVVSGCRTVAGDFCDLSTPIRPTVESLAAMSDAEVEEALAHNEYGRIACGWRA